MHVSMYTPWRAQCGISDYSRWLVGALRSLPEIDSLMIAEAPETPITGGMKALLRFPQEERRYRELARQLQGDVAHIQHQYFFFGGVAPHKNHARAFLNALSIPAVMTVHEIAGISVSNQTLSKQSVSNQLEQRQNGPFGVQQAIRYTNRANFLHPNIRALIVHTSADREALIALGAKADSVHHLPHPVPPASPMPVRDEALRKWGLEGKQVVTLFGFLASKKGHTLALDMMHHLPAHVVLLFAGGQHPQDHTAYVAGLKERIAQEGLSERVRITGYLEEADIPTIMAATDVAIAPFLQSSGSGSLANLFAYGRAVVASDIPPHREIAQANTGTLALFPSGDVPTLIERVGSLLNSSEHQRSLQQAALNYSERHSYLEMARATYKIYQKLF